MKNILIFDQQSSGHHKEFLGHIYLNSDDRNNIYFFLIPLEVKEYLLELNPLKKNQFFIPLPVLISDHLNIKLGNHILHLTVKLNIELLLFMNLDPYQFILGTRKWTKADIIIRGILFSPPHRLPLKEVMRKTRKILQLKWILRNQKIQTIFILDELELSPLLKFGKVFKELPDPVQKFELCEVATINKKYRLKADDKVFLSFGTLTPRKNLRNIIVAYSKIYRKGFKLLLVGKGKSNLIDKVTELINSLDVEIKNSIVLNNTFVSYEEMDSLFQRSDLVLMIYKDFYVSSGILGKAAMYNKKILVSNFGLSAEIVKRYNFGRLVKTNIESIANGMISLIDEEVESNSISINDYIEHKTSKNFTRILLQLNNN